MANAQNDNSAGRLDILGLPVISRSIETDWSFGLAATTTFHFTNKDSLTRTSNLQAAALYSLEHQFYAGLNGKIFFPHERFILTNQFSYSLFPDSFWGIGKKAPDSNKEDYTFKQYYIFLHGQRLIGRKFFLGLEYEYQRLFKVDHKAGGLFDQQNVAGRTPYSVSGAGVSISYDTRNHAFVPNKGNFVQLSFTYFEPFFGSSFRYSNMVLDMRKFIRIYRKQVLALQAYGFFNMGEVPLRSLASFGGANSMRGYYNGRYRDKNQVVIQSEYRMPVYKRIGAVVFASVGDISHRLTDYSFDDLKYSYGAGLRFVLNRKEKLNLRLDYGIGEQKQHGYYFQIAEAF